MNTYTHFTLTHFDPATGGTFEQNYRWSWQPDHEFGDLFIQIDADAEDGDWLFTEGLNDLGELSNWISQQEREFARELLAWQRFDAAQAA